MIQLSQVTYVKFQGSSSSVKGALSRMPKHILGLSYLVNKVFFVEIIMLKSLHKWMNGEEFPDDKSLFAVSFVLERWADMQVKHLRE